MKVLLLVGVLAIVQASGQYDSPLQRLRELQIPSKDYPTYTDENQYKNDVKVLKYRVDQLEQEVKALPDQIFDLLSEFSKGLGQKTELQQGDNEPGNSGLEQGHLSKEESGPNKEGDKVVINRGKENNDNTLDLASMRMLLENIQRSRMDETKREQTETKSDALLRILKTLRKK